ncbi:MAG: zinc-dependent metalloprotease [Verrucomicrobia bacterium]|nr:zinc-dependent metalloprotease [Cytophagales bacterium]
MQKFTSIKFFLLALLISGTVFSNQTFAQKKKKGQTPPTNPVTVPAVLPVKPGIKPYKEVITAKAKTTKGLFTVHKIEDKYYFEIPDSLFNRDFMAITRVAKASTSLGYGGELANEQVLKWEKGPDNKVFLRVPLFINVGRDTLQPIAQAVKNSNVEPIAAVFDIKAIRKDSTTVIDVSDFFKADNQILSLSPFSKQLYKITALQSDRSYIQSIKSFPINTEVRTVKTFGVTPPTPNFGGLPSPIPTVTLPAGAETGVITLEMNTSMILLPKVAARKRLFDPRVGYFANGYTVYDENLQKTESETFIVHWKLEPKTAEDAEKQKRGEAIEPKKPIVFYIDPATPTKWRKYLKQGVDDWTVAFEKAGWKNAIMAKDAPDNDPNFSTEDARYSVIRYFASGIENAYGPNVHDPRSGEIIESHIGWYHNVMNLLKKWYLIQTAASDPKARKMKFDDELMGQLIRFVSSHEVGHTLGLRHNFGASTATPVAMLRNKDFTNKNGHTSSIMDYARFNYVAQPEDGVTDFFPRIGDYDIWAIEWGYKPTYDVKTEQDEKKVLNKWYNEKVANNRRLLFLTETNAYDPRSQSEDIGDNAMLASEYGIKNLQRIMPNLSDWTKEEAQNYGNLSEMYNEVFFQFRRYLGHVTKYIGGVYETPKTTDQQGNVYEPTPKSLQQDAMNFLNKNALQTPTWLLNQQILSKTTPGQGVEAVRNLHETVINNLFETSRMQRLIEAGAVRNDVYTLENLFTDARQNIFSEIYTRKSTDNFRRNLQKIFTEKLMLIVNPPTALQLPQGFSFPNSVPSPTTDPKKSDITSMARATLAILRSDISVALPTVTDKMTRYHLQDLVARINKTLDPK